MAASVQNPSKSERLRQLDRDDTQGKIDIASFLRNEIKAEEVAATLRDCMGAMRTIVSKHGVETVPDYTARMNAVALLMAYQYGRPVERRIEARVPPETAGQQAGDALDVERLNKAPAAAQAIVEALLRLSPDAREAAKRILADAPPDGLIVEAETVGNP